MQRPILINQDPPRPRRAHTIISRGSTRGRSTRSRGNLAEAATASSRRPSRRAPATSSRRSRPQAAAGDRQLIGVPQKPPSWSISGRCWPTTTEWWVARGRLHRDPRLRDDDGRRRTTARRPGDQAGGADQGRSRSPTTVRLLRHPVADQQRDSRNAITHGMDAFLGGPAQWELDARDGRRGRVATRSASSRAPPSTTSRSTVTVRGRAATLVHRRNFDGSSSRSRTAFNIFRRPNSASARPPRSQLLSRRDLGRRVQPDLLRSPGPTRPTSPAAPTPLRHSWINGVEPVP